MVARYGAPFGWFWRLPRHQVIELRLNLGNSQQLDLQLLQNLPHLCGQLYDLPVIRRNAYPTSSASLAAWAGLSP